MRKFTFIVFSLLLTLCILFPQIPVQAIPIRHFSFFSSNQQQLDSFSGDTYIISVSSDGVIGNLHSTTPSISDDGRYVAFESGANNLVTGDTNIKPDIFVHDLQTGETTRVSVASDGTQVNDCSYEPSISGNGRFVAFESYASNLVPGDTNNRTDIFVHDLQTGETKIVSNSYYGLSADKISGSPSISSDGRFIAFHSYASNLVPGDTNNQVDIFVHDQQTNVTTRLSLAYDGTQPNDHSYSPSISADGRYVAFDSFASNLVQEDTNDQRDVFIVDRVTGQIQRLSVSSDGIQGNGTSQDAFISASGRFVGFNSLSTNLVIGDTNETHDAFVFDRVTGQIRLVSATSEGLQGNNSSYTHSISSDGKYVVFDSYASNLVPGDTNNERDIFMQDKETNQLIRVSVASDGSQGDNKSLYGTITPDGKYVVFVSDSTNLVPGDTNGCGDIFVRQIFQDTIPDDDTWDIGFLPQSDGYSFENYSDSSLYDFTKNDMIEMFGEDAVCVNINGDCVLNISAQMWLNQVNTSMSGGHCDGMAVTSLRLFVPEYEAPSDFDIGAINTYSLQKTIEVRRYIANFFVRQLANPVMSYKSEVVKKTPVQILEELKINMTSSPLDPATLIVRTIDVNGKRSGHAVTPYKIEDMLDGTHKIWVYDNNHPGDSSRYVLINTIENTWSYYMGDIHGTWSGNGFTNTLGYVPISYYDEPPVCAWYSNSVQEDSLSYFWFHGDGSLLVEDLSGNRLGYMDGQYFNEIDSGYLAFLDLGVDESSELIYVLPDGEYSLTINGDQAQEPGNASLIKFGPDHSLNIDNIPVTENKSTQFLVNANGSDVMISADHEIENINLSLVKENATSSSSLTVNNVDIGSQDLLNVDAQNQRFIIDGSQAGDGVYDFSFELLTGVGIQEFIYNGISISENSTHYINYAEWDGVSDILLEIDLNSDGSIDEEIWLSNGDSQNTIFIPIIIN